MSESCKIEKTTNYDTNSQSKVGGGNNRVLEIDYFRSFIIILLVFMHSFVYNANTKSWPEPLGVQSLELYHFIQEISFSCLLESFTLISGYVFGYIYLVKNRELKLVPLIRGKIFRLMIPSIVFSIIYGCIFEQGISFSLKTIYQVVSGIGHMWYLPMLFQCFIFSYFLIRCNLNKWILLSSLLLLSIFSCMVPNYMQISRTLYYLFFFYLGIQLVQIREYIIEKVDTRVKYFIISYLIALLPCLWLRIELEENSYYILANSIRLLYSIFGTLFLLMLFCKISLQHNNKMLKIVTFISGCSMGVYIFHQFILKIFYYKTDVAASCGNIMLPWVAFIISLTLSLLATCCAKKTSIGRFLLC